MGWLWSNNSSPKTSSSDKEPSITPPSIASNPPEAPSDSPPLPSKPAAPSKPLSRDEQAEAEFQSFLRELASESSPPTTTTRSSLPPNPFFPNPQTSSTTAPTTTASSQTITSPSSSRSPFGSSIYPSSMSCRSYFDAAYHCQLPGGQFLNVYRHGSLRDCTELWSSFWFCMRTNRGFMSEEEREERVRNFYKEKEEKLRKGSNSEEVWQARGEGEGIRDEDCWGGKIFGVNLDRYLRGEDG